MLHQARMEEIRRAVAMLPEKQRAAVLMHKYQEMEYSQIAKALNCIGLDGQGGPTIDPCGECEPCRAIAEGRHIDVVEMDAASHTGVDDVREIIEAVRYAAVSARYKIYIIDEAHMLSKSSFNAVESRFACRNVSERSLLTVRAR